MFPRPCLSRFSPRLANPEREVAEQRAVGSPAPGPAALQACRAPAAVGLREPPGQVSQVTPAKQAPPARPGPLARQAPPARQASRARAERQASQARAARQEAQEMRAGAGWVSPGPVVEEEEEGTLAGAVREARAARR